MSIQKQNYDYLILPDGNYRINFFGDKGFKGDDGEKGAKGQKGREGIDGTDGTDGDKGQKGTKGNFEKGQKGDASTQIFTFKGEVEDASKLPTSDNEAGDVYFVEDSSSLVVWDGVEWLTLANQPESIKGDKGTAGTDGTK